MLRDVWNWVWQPEYQAIEAEIVNLICVTDDLDEIAILRMELRLLDEMRINDPHTHGGKYV